MNTAPAIVPPAVPPPESRPTPAEIWGQTTAELDGLRRSTQGGPASLARQAELRDRATAALQLITDDDPLALEIVCQAVFWWPSLHGYPEPGPESDEMEREKHALWNRAISIENRRSALDRRARYASLLRDTMYLTYSYYVTYNDTLLDSKIKRGSLQFARPHVSPEACPSIDYAQLQLMSAMLFGPWIQTLEALSEEIIRDFGHDAPELATLLDISSEECGVVSACSRQRYRFERALALRERGLGPDHPLTNVSRFNLAAILDEEGATRRSEAILRIIVASSMRDRSTILALRELAERDIRHQRWRAAAEHLSNASRLGEVILSRENGDDIMLIYETNSLRAHAFVHGRDYIRAEAVFRTFGEEEPYPLAEILRIQGKNEEALVYYDKEIALRSAGSQPRSSKPALVRAYRGRAAALVGLGRTEESQADLKSACYTIFISNEKERNRDASCARIFQR